jgi:UDP-N-acetylglucosamine 2-epimerase
MLSCGSVPMHTGRTKVLCIVGTRPEAVRDGVVRLVGTHFDSLTGEAQRLLDDPDAYRTMASGVSPYGDGHAAARIVSVLRRGHDGGTGGGRRG